MDFPDLGLLSFLDRETSALREIEAQRSETYTEPPPWLRKDAADGSAYLVLCALDPTTAVLQRDAVLACVRRLYQRLHSSLLDSSTFDPGHFTGLSAAAWRCIATKLQRTVLLCDPTTPPLLTAYACCNGNGNSPDNMSGDDKCMMLLRLPSPVNDVQNPPGFASLNQVATVEQGIAHAKRVILESGSLQAVHARLERMLRKDLDTLRHALAVPIPGGKRASKSQLLQLLKACIKSDTVLTRTE